MPNETAICGPTIELLLRHLEGTGTGRTNFQVPDEMRRMAEQSVTQARQALESFLRRPAHGG
jgi:hypothetical protein